MNPRPRPWQGRALPTELLPRGDIFGLSSLLRRGNTSNPFRGCHTGATLWRVLSNVLSTITSVSFADDIVWERSDSNARSPSRRMIYSHLQLPLCDSPIKRSFNRTTKHFFLFIRRRNIWLKPAQSFKTRLFSICGSGGIRTHDPRINSPLR